MNHFRTVKRISEASDDELTAVVGSSKAAILKVHFKEKGNADL